MGATQNVPFCINVQVNLSSNAPHCTFVALLALFMVLASIYFFPFFNIVQGGNVPD